MLELKISERLRGEMEAAVEAHMHAAMQDGDYWFTFSDQWDINIVSDDSLDPSEFLSAVAYPAIDCGFKGKHTITSIYAVIKGDIDV